jgi:hypothetical protein
MIVKLVQEKSLKLAQDAESKAFFYKMIADYYRYVAESSEGETLIEVRDGALKNYQES